MGGSKYLRVLLATLVFGIFGQSNAQDVRIFSIATGGVAGTYYPVGGMLADVISQPPGARPCDRGGSCGVPNLIAIASASDGSVANVRAVSEGSVDSGFAQSDVAHDAFVGQGHFAETGAVDELRLIASLYFEHAHVVAKDADSIADLQGRRISIDNDGSGTQRVAQLLLAAHGLGADNFVAHKVKPSQAIEMMRKDELDAFVIVAGSPTASVEEAVRDLGARVLPLEQDAVRGMLSEHPFFADTRIPPDSYPGQVEPVSTVGVVAQWITSAEQDEALVYALTQSLWHPNSRLLLDNGHSRGRSITLLTALDGAGIELHPGAARFYREQGLDVD